MDKKTAYANELVKLIKVNTVTGIGNENFAEFRSVLKEVFPSLHEKCEMRILGENALLYKWTGKSNEKPIVLMGHQDVVPCDDGDWKYPPFEGVIEDGRIWGRGTMDCKNTLYACMKAVDELISEGFVPDYDVYIACSDNEETSGNGAPSIVNYLKNKGIRPYIVLDEGGAILPEPFPGMTKPYAMIGVLEKGYADIKFTARSKGGHSSSPPKNTPIARLSQFVTEVENSKIFKKKMEPEVEEMLGEMSKAMTGPLKFLLGHLNVFKPIVTWALPKVSPYGNALLSTTMVFTMSKASSAANVIPQEASVTANLRFIPHQGVDESLQALKAIADKYDIETEVLNARNAMPPVSTKSDGYKLLTDTVKEVFPEIGIAPYVIMGGTDCRHFQEISDCAMRFTPMLLHPDQMASMHASNESLDIDTLYDGVQFMRKLIQANK